MPGRRSRHFPRAIAGRYDHFGASVAIDGDLIAVGAPWSNGSDGAVYVYERTRNGWVERQILTLDDPVPGMRLGRSVAITGGAIVALAGGENGVAAPAAGYRFERSRGEWVASDGTVAPALAAASTDPETAQGVIDALTGSGRLDLPVSFAPAARPEAPDTVIASDGLEARVEVRWEGDQLDAIVYRVMRGGQLVSVASSDDRLYVDRSADVIPGQPYDYCVQVEDMASQLSDSTCDPGMRIIFAPSNLIASDGDYDTHVLVTWTDLSGVEKGYYVKRNNTLIATTPANAKLYRDTSSSVVAGTRYNYTVSAFDAGAYQSIAKSDSGWRGAVLPPLDVAASDGEYFDKIVVTWTDQAGYETGFNVYRDSVLVYTAPASPDTLRKVAWHDNGIVYGAQYAYCVTTIGAGGVESRRVCDPGRTGLTAPDNVAASDDAFDDRVKITWKDMSNLEDGYEISRSMSGSSEPDTRPHGGKPKVYPHNELTPAPGAVVLDTTRLNATSYSDFTAVAGTTYVYYVRAINNDGGESAPGSDEGVRSVVLAPYDVAATDGTFEDFAELTWKSNSTTTVLFKIFRGGLFIKSVNGADRSYRDYGGTAGQEYNYEVVAVTATADEARASPTPGRRELLAPTRVSASDAEYEDKIVISWDDNSRIETGYRVYRRDTSATAVD